MSLAHAVALAEARTYLAALADQAPCHEASAGYQRTLLHLDSLHLDPLHGDNLPALDTRGLIPGGAVLGVLAEAAIEDLAGHGLDALQVELVLAMLDDARELDAHAHSER